MGNREFFLEKSKSGYYTLYYSVAGIKKYIHSRYDPRAEAEMILKKIDANKYDFIVLAGNGLGYMLDKLKATKKIKKIIVIEKENKIYDKFLELNKDFPFTDVDFLVNKDKEYVVNYIVNNFNLINYRGFHLIELSPIVNSESTYYQELKTLLNETLEKKINNQLTESRLGISLLNNFLNNLHQVKDINLIKINKALSRDKSVIIVSAGMSLAEDVEKLKLLQDNFYIFTVDTALKYLLKNNIIPDAVFSMDPQFYTYHHFYPETLNKRITCILDIFTGFPVLKINKRFSFIISNNFISDFLFEKEDIIKSSGGSITNFIFQYVQDYFGEIIFLGLDLCYDNLNMYIPHTYLNQYFLKRNDRYFSLQTQYLKFYLSRAKRKIKFNNKEYSTTLSMINYYEWLQEAVKNKNVYFSKNSRIDFKNIKKQDIENIKRNKKKENLFFIKKVYRDKIIEKVKELIKNKDLLKSITDIIIFSKYINQWQEFNDREKEKIYKKNYNYLEKKIEKLI